MGALRDTTLRQFRALSFVADTGSFTAAAAALGVTQPAVTSQIQALEAHVGLKLLERSAGRMRLTDAGAEVRALHAIIGEALGASGQRLEAMRTGVGGHVAIGAVSTAKYFVPFAIAGLRRAHPGIEIALVIGNRGEVLARLRQNELDLAVIGRPPDDMALERQSLGENPHVIIAAPGHALAGRAGLDARDLGEETFLLREPGSGTRGLMERFFKEGGLNPRIGMEITSNETIKQAVMAGLGIAFISAHCVAAERADGRLAALSVAGLPLMREWFVVRRPERPLLPATRLVFAFLAREGRRFLPGAA